MITNSIILAAGKGTRMFSNQAKVLHKIGEKPLLQHVIDATKDIVDKIHIIYGFQGDVVRKNINGEVLNWVEQIEQKGTGHAVLQALPFVEDNVLVLVLYGDVPLITTQTLEDLKKQSSHSGFAILTTQLDNPTGYGRIVRDENSKIIEIVEQKDANTEQLNITEVNTGIMAVRSDLLKKYLKNITPNNAQNELYLTDIIKMAVDDNIDIGFVDCLDEFEVAGVNDKKQLAQLERVFQLQCAENMMSKGLEIKDNYRFDLRGKLKFGKDCVCDINVIFEGEVVLGENVNIGANCIIKNSTIGDNSIIEPNSIIDNAIIEQNVVVGPFARIRPETKLKNNVKVGNFVEVKKTTIDENSKANHLSYLGDSIVGKNVNIGAGVITCNYDGVNKHQTIIEDGAFIGSDSQLIAPVKIGKNSTIGAGSSISKDTAKDKLTLSRAKQLTIPNWQRPKK